MQFFVKDSWRGMKEFEWAEVFDPRTDRWGRF
jgi:hypothetical protein